MHSRLRAGVSHTHQTGLSSGELSRWPTLTRSCPLAFTIHLLCEMVTLWLGARTYQAEEETVLSYSLRCSGVLHPRLVPDGKEARRNGRSTSTFRTVCNISASSPCSFLKGNVPSCTEPQVGHDKSERRREAILGAPFRRIFDCCPLLAPRRWQHSQAFWAFLGIKVRAPPSQGCCVA